MSPSDKPSYFASPDSLRENTSPLHLRSTVIHGTPEKDQDVCIHHPSQESTEAHGDTLLEIPPLIRERVRTHLQQHPDAEIEASSDDTLPPPPPPKRCDSFHIPSDTFFEQGAPLDAQDTHQDPHKTLMMDADSARLMREAAICQVVTQKNVRQHGVMRRIVSWFWRCVLRRR